MTQTALKIYEKINLKLPLEQRRFFHYLNEVINELITRYGAEYVLDDAYREKGFMPIESLNDPLQIKTQFVNPVLYGITALADPQNQTAKAEEIRLADEAYTDVWNAAIKSRTIKRPGW